MLRANQRNNLFHESMEESIDFVFEQMSDDAAPNTTQRIYKMLASFE